MMIENDFGDFGRGEVDEVEEVVEKKVGVNFASKEFFEQVLELLNTPEGFDDLFNEELVKGGTFVVNKSAIVQFHQLLVKLNEIGEDKFDKFLNMLDHVKVRNHGLKQTIANALIKFLQKTPVKNKESNIPITIIKILIDGNLLNIKEKNRKKIIKVVKYVSSRLQDKKTGNAFADELSKLMKENANQFNYIVFFGSLLKLNTVLSKEFNESISNTIAEFFDNKILDDEEKEKNLAKERILAPVFKNFTTENQHLIYEKIFPRIESLLLRSKQNFKFLENFLSYSGVKSYKDEFTSSVFDKFSDVFYSTDKNVFDAGVNAMDSLSKSSDRKILLKHLLDKEFLADKAELNINTCYYLIQILTHNNEKLKNNYFSNTELLEITLSILEKLENLSNENNKTKFDFILENLVIGLMQNESDNTMISNGLTEKLNNQLKKILTSSSLSNFYHFIYIIVSIISRKFYLTVNKSVYDNLFNLSNSMVMNNNNIRNLLGIISSCVAISTSKEEVFNAGNNKKNLNTGVQNAFIKSTLLKSSAVLFNLTQFDFINIINIFKNIINSATLKDYFADEIEEISKIVSYIIFRPGNKNAEEIAFKELVSQLNKETLDIIIKHSFIFITNAGKINQKITFHKLRIILEKYSQFYQEFNNSDFIKYITLTHIPHVNHDVNFGNQKSKSHNRSNAFLNELYKKFTNIELNNDIFLRLEENYKDLSEFIFSDLGLYNKTNKYLMYSSREVLKRMYEHLQNPSLAKNILKNSIAELQYGKCKYIEKLIAYYNKEVEYISFYDLSDLVEGLTQMEKEKEKVENITVLDVKEVVETPAATQSKANTKGGKTQTQTKQPAKSGNTQKKEEKTEKVDKATKEKELKAYFDKYLTSLGLKLNFTVDRIKPVVELTNKHSYQHQHDPETKSHKKENFKFVIKHLWQLMNVKTISQNILNTLYNLFNSNPLSKQLAFEFSHLMHLQANPELFEEILNKYPNLVININEKLENLLIKSEDKVKVNKIFNLLDFVIIKLLFFIILSTHISNEDKISSVNILIQIIENFNQESLNFNDISLLAVSLLKTSYNHENLTSLLEIFLKKGKEENFLTLCDDLLDYEYVAKVTFLTQILNLNLVSIRKYKNLVYKIWVLIFDENDNISLLGKEIWNKFNLYLDPSFVNSGEFDVAFTHHRLKDCANRAIRAYAYLIPTEVGNVLKKFSEFYEKELTHHNENNDQSRIEEEPLRLIYLDFINETIALFSNEMKTTALDFLMRISDKESDEDIFDSMNVTIYNIIKSITDESVVENILSSIFKNIKNIATKTNQKEINFKNLKIILMMLNSILRKKSNSQVLKETTDELFDALHSLALKLTSNEVLILISNCYQYLAKNNTEKSLQLLNSILTEFSKNTSTLSNIGSLFILAGIIKCFGINSIKQYKIDEIITNNMHKNKSPIEKQNAITLIKTLTESMKKLYEPYLVSKFDLICELISDRDEKVRETTQQAIKSFMKEISGYGVKTIMPRLIKDLHSMNWRSKVVNIEILGQFAFCAPKQLSIYIPKVIKEIMQVFKDPHHKVQETAVMVLKDISSVIKNPEIVDLSDLLIDAVANPYEHSKNALTALLETDFKHAIDPPSLALIIPIIDYNLKVQSETLKKQAAHVIGSIANLISNPVDIYQYIDIIIPALKSALFDAIPECRNAMAKAIGALTKNLGPSYLEEMFKYLRQFLEINSDTVQKSGAAQAYAEILVSFGESFIEKQLPFIISKVQDSDAITKEGYLSIFVFLPGCLGERFEKYFELVFPLIIEGFSDDHENVRNVSNKIFEICIKLYAKRNTKQLVDPLLVRLFDSNWRIRNSSIALIKTLIMNLNKEFFKESSTYFTKEQRDEILTYTFVLKADQSGNTATIANMIWRDYVDNIPKYLSKVLKQIYEQIIVLLSSENDEAFDIAECCIKMLVTKFSDKFFMELLPTIKDTIVEKKDIENTVYASFYIIQLAVTEASEKLLSGFKEKILRIVNENTYTPYSSVRKSLASIVYGLARKFDEYNTNKTFIYNIMKQARNKPVLEQKNTLEIVASLVEISQGEVLHNVINEIFRKPYEEGFLELAVMIAKEIADSIRDPVDLKDLYNNITEAMNSLPASTVDMMVAITENLDEKFLPIFVDYLEKLHIKYSSQSKNAESKNKDHSVHLSEIIVKFLENTGQDITIINKSLFEVSISLLIYDNEDIIRNVGITIKEIIDKAEKSEIDKFVHSFLRKISEIEDLYGYEGADKFERLNSKFKLILDNLLYLVQNGLLYSEDKLAAADYVQKIIDNTTRQVMKPYIMKMIGPIIRILSEKYAPNVKEKVLDNAKALIMKSKEDVKGISPQLQSVLVKCLSDSSQPNSERMQLKAGENILRLLQYYPRVDVIINDIMKSITTKIEKKELTTLVEIEIMSDIIRFYGHHLKPNVITDQYARILNLINNNQEIPFDLLVILLSSYTRLYSNPSECEKIVENTLIKEELPRKLFNFITIYNGDLNYFNANKKNIMKILKPLPKDQAVILLKSLGKEINKYKFFKDFDEKKTGELLENYEKSIEQIILETGLLTSTNHILDANLCVFILSLSYLKLYETNKQVFGKIFDFILQLIQQGKVNSQLLVNCLSLLVLKEIKPNPDKDLILHALGDMDLEENEVEAIEAFLKKVYYLYS